MINQVTHILLDAARMGARMEEALKLNKEHDCLYRDSPDQKMTSVAPYIFRFQQNTPFADWYMQEGWGNSWGILFKSSYGLPDLYKHFRKFVRVMTEEQKEIYFRFYDPRVLRIFLPNSEATDIRDFFGPVEFFAPEAEDPAVLLKFMQTNGALKSQEIKLADIYQPKPKVEKPVAEAAPVMPVAAVPVAQKPIPPTPAPAAKETPKAASPEAKPANKGSKWNMFDD